MPSINKDETPDVLKTYIFHGLDFTITKGSRQATADCPFCGNSGKFTVTVDDGLSRCLSCNVGSENGKAIRGMNNYSFIRALHKASLSQVNQPYASLAEDRSLLDPETLKAWGVCVSLSSGNWIVPGHSHDGKLNQLYKYVKTGERMLLSASPKMGVQIYGIPLFDASKPFVYICEGVWDAMALWEILGRVKRSSTGELIQTTSEDASLRSEANVIALPGNNVFQNEWLPLFVDKVVVLMFDSDHPKKNPSTGETIQPAGFSGMMRAAGILLGSKNPPKSVDYLHWGEEGYDPSLKTGYDVRDALKSTGTALKSRITALSGLLGRIAQAPEAWRIGAQKAKNGHDTANDDELLPCDDYRKLVNQWRKAMKWTDGLDHGLSTMLAVVVSTKSVGDQLWAKIIGPAACGKSTLCEAISMNKRYVYPKSTMRGFHSGFSDEESGEDVSLISKANGKTLVTKDGDTLLQAPNLPQILSEARDVYDTVSRTSYRNRASRDYAGIRITWILCGTSSLRQIDSSELGERFLDCVIMEQIDDDLEDEILMRVAHRADRNMSIEAGEDTESQQDPEMTTCMKLTGGYVGYLREHAQELLGVVEIEENNLRTITRYAKFVAFMRARPSTRQDETAEREFATRLTSQLIRLGKCLAVVLNQTRVNDEVMGRVKRIAMDTARGITLKVVVEMLKPEYNEVGIFIVGLATAVSISDDRCRSIMRFLVKIGVVEVFKPSFKPGEAVPKARHRLTRTFRKLCNEVL